MHTLRNILVVAALLVPMGALAQVEPVRYSVSPEVPGPHQTVELLVEGVGTFLGNAQITWRRDGVVVRQGAGERVLRITLGGLGERTVVDVSIVSETEGTFTHTFALTPSSVGMLWEADTTTPPLYRGKPLYSAGSPLRVIALPIAYAGGSRIASGALSYQWSRNDEPEVQASGLGRSTFAFTGSQLRSSETVGVDVYYGNTRVARGETTIGATVPRIVLYQYDALRGALYDMALPAGIDLEGREITVKAEPYHFSSASDKQGSLVYAWQLNDEDISGPDAQRGVLTLRQTGSGTGEATLRASLQNYDSATFVQSAESLLRIVFGNEASLLNTVLGI